MGVNGCSARDIFGSPDDIKLRACAILFAQVSGSDPVFKDLIDKYFEGVSDPRTLSLIGIEPDAR